MKSFEKLTLEELEEALQIILRPLGRNFQVISSTPYSSGNRFEGYKIILETYDWEVPYVVGKVTKRHPLIFRRDAIFLEVNDRNENWLSKDFLEGGREVSAAHRQWIQDHCVPEIRSFDKISYREIIEFFQNYLYEADLESSVRIGKILWNPSENRYDLILNFKKGTDCTNGCTDWFSGKIYLTPHGVETGIKAVREKFLTGDIGKKWRSFLDQIGVPKSCPPARIRKGSENEIQGKIYLIDSIISGFLDDSEMILFFEKGRPKDMFTLSRKEFEKQAHAVPEDGISAAY